MKPKCNRHPITPYLYSSRGHPSHANTAAQKNKSHACNRRRVTYATTNPPEVSTCFFFLTFLMRLILSSCDMLPFTRAIARYLSNICPGPSTTGSRTQKPFAHSAAERYTDATLTKNLVTSAGAHAYHTCRQHLRSFDEQHSSFFFWVQLAQQVVFLGTVLALSFLGLLRLIL